MFLLRWRLPGCAALARWAAIFVLAAAGCLAGIAPANALDLFATHRVTAQFATTDGKPMADAPVRVFAPGNATTPVETGHTDAHGKFVFDADRDGMWSAEARSPSQVARVMIRVGAGAPQQQQSRLPPYLVIGGLIVLVALAWWYRLVRWRARRPQP